MWKRVFPCICAILCHCYNWRHFLRMQKRLWMAFAFIHVPIVPARHILLPWCCKVWSSWSILSNHESASDWDWDLKTSARLIRSAGAGQGRAGQGGGRGPWLFIGWGGLAWIDIIAATEPSAKLSQSRRRPLLGPYHKRRVALRLYAVPFDLCVGVPISCMSTYRV